MPITCPIGLLPQSGRTLVRGRERFEGRTFTRGSSVPISRLDIVVTLCAHACPHRFKPGEGLGCTGNIVKADPVNNQANNRGESCHPVVREGTQMGTVKGSGGDPQPVRELFD